MRRWAALLVMPATLCGCVLVHPVTIAGPLDRPTLLVRSTGIFNAVRTCAHAFAVTRADDGTVMWSARGPAEACIRTEAVAYGTTPPAFVTDVAPQPLAENTLYRVTARSTSGVPAGASIAFSDGRWRVLR